MASHPDSVQHHAVFGWDLGAAECGCLQSGQLGDTCDMAAPEEVCPCNIYIYITIHNQEVIYESWQGKVSGECADWLDSFLSTSPSLFWSWQHIALEE